MNIHDRVDKIIAFYEGGMRCADIAAKQLIRITDVYTILRLAGFRLTKAGDLNPTVQGEIIAAYKSGMYVKEVVDKLGFSLYVVRRCLRENGVKVHLYHYPEKGMAQPHLRKRNALIINLYRGGMPIVQIGKRQEINLSSFRVRQIVRKYAPDIYRHRHPELAP